MNLRQHEKDERQNLRRIIEAMNRLYCSMGGRTNRPERKALFKAIIVLQRDIERANLEELRSKETA